MATGERFSATFSKGSEEIYEFCCTPCSKVNDIVEAVNQCLDCDEFFCAKCIDFHKKFGAFSGHKVLGQKEMKIVKGSKSKKPPPPPQKCQVHGGERMTVYCSDHDVVCCNTGISVKHKNCDGTTYILDAASGIKSSNQIQTTRSNIKSTLKDVKREKDARQRDLADLDKDKTANIGKVKDHAERLIERIRELEKASIEEIKAKHGELREDLSGKIASLDDTLSILDSDLQNLDSSHGNNEPKLFVDVKLSQGHEAEGRELLQEFRKTRKHNLKFMVRTNIEDVLMNTNMLGSFINDSPVSKANVKGIYNVKCKQDKHKCVIEGTCLLPDGTMVISDFNNKRIKRLDDNFNVADYCDMPGEPWGITCTASDEVAVTLRDQKKVQFVSIKSSMSTTRSFRTRGCCRAISYSGGQLFVSCGGVNSGTRTEGPGHVSVYSVMGELACTIQTDPSGQRLFQVPLHICFSCTGDNVYIADAADGFRLFKRDGTLLDSFTDPSLSCTYGVCTLDNGHVLVGGYFSNNVIQFDGNGKKVAELLNVTDGIKTPQSLYYDSRKSRLIVTMETYDYIKVFDIL